MAYLDWLYSEEGQTLTNWGVEGESYTVDENGNKAFIKSFLDEHGGLSSSGLGTLLMCGYRKSDAYMASLSESEAASLELALGYRGNLHQNIRTFLCGVHRRKRPPALPVAF